MYHDDVAACCAWKGCSQELSTKGQLLIVSEAPWPVSLAGPTSSKPTPLLVVNLVLGDRSCPYTYNHLQPLIFVFTKSTLMDLTQVHPCLNPRGRGFVEIRSRTEVFDHKPGFGRMCERFSADEASEVHGS